MEEKLNWKEKYAAFVILIIGSGMLALEILAFISSKTSLSSQTENSISINKSELLAHTRAFVVIIACLLASAALFSRKRIGWILGVPTLLFSATLAGYLVYFGYIMYGAPIALAALLFFLLIGLALYFLLSVSARAKYKVGKQSLLPTLVFLMVLCAMFFFLK